MPNEPQRATISEAECASPMQVCCEENTNDEPLPNIQILWATTFGHLLASEQVVKAFAIQLGECHRLLGASLECITKGEGNPWMRIARAEAAAGVETNE